MSIARVNSFAFAGIDAQRVEVQVQIAAGLPNFLVVGLPDKAVGEARERVRAALTAMGLALPPKRVLVNLAPADMQKEGSHFDLPIALAVLAAMDILPREELAEFAALGELSLDGRINQVAGVLPAAIAAAGRNLGLICPESQGSEASWAGDLTVLAAPDLLCLINHFRGTQLLSAPPPGELGAGAKHLDLGDIRGLESGRRALEIAAAGAHNLLMLGPITQLIEQGITPCFKIVCPPGTPWQCGYLLWTAAVKGRVQRGAIPFDMANKDKVSAWRSDQELNSS